METNTFNGKTALVIGGTSGMGKATVKVLLENGARVFVASKAQEHIDATVSEFKNHGTIEGWKVDLCSQRSVCDFIKKLEGLEEINYLVNTSGIFSPKPFLE